MPSCRYPSKTEVNFQQSADELAQPLQERESDEESLIIVDDCDNTPTELNPFQITCDSTFTNQHQVVMRNERPRNRKRRK